MNNRDIQKLLAEQRSQASIYTKTDHEVAMTINNRLKDSATHDKKRNTMLAKYQDTDFLAYKKSLLHDLAQTPEWQAAHAEGIKRRENNGWKEKNLKAREKTFKPIHTPYGDFASKQAAVEGMAKQGVVNAGGKLSVWLKTNPDEYYYIKTPQN